MQLPRKWLLLLAAVLTAAAYFLILCTDWGSYGGNAWTAVGLDATVVIAAFACWEVFRTESITQLRAVAAAVGGPLALFALVTFWYAVKRYVGS